MRSLLSAVLVFLAVSVFAQPQQKKKGKVTVKNSKGVVIEEGRVKDHLKTGLWIRRYDTGDTQEVANYLRDTMNGAYRSYFQKGGVQVSGTYTMGTRTGVWERYSRSHQPVQVSSFDAKGKELGLQQTFSESGKLRKSRMVTADGYEYAKEYDLPEKLTKRYTLLNGRKEGDFYTYERNYGNNADTLPTGITSYHEGVKNGADRNWANVAGRRVLIREGWYKNGKKDSVFRFYYREGQLKEESHYSNDKRNGLQTTYNNEGRLLTESSFIMGKKNGAQKEYTGNVLTQVDWYTLGVQDSSRHYNPEGRLLSYMKRLDPQTEQHWEYQANGKEAARWTEKEHRKDGPYAAFYPDGKKKWEMTFKWGRVEGEWRAWNEKAVLVIRASAQDGRDTMERVFTNKGMQLKQQNAQAPSRPDTAYENQLRRYMPPYVSRMANNNKTEDWEEGPMLLDREPVIDRVAEESDQVFLYAEVMPVFPGEEGAFMQYLKKNIKYPIIEQESGKQGVVYIRFVVRPDGSITDVQAAKEVAGAPGLTKEAIRVIKGMPNWIPGKMNGRNVAISVTQPVRFQLQ